MVLWFGGNENGWGGAGAAITPPAPFTPEVTNGAAAANATVMLAATQAIGAGPTGIRAGSFGGAGTAPALSVITTSLPDATAGSAYTFALAATGGTGTGYTWAVTAGALPGGLALSAGGLITGTPPATGTATFTVTVTDSGAGTATQALGITTDAASGGTTLIITTTSLPAATAGAAYSATLTASGGTQPYTWSLASGALPAGLALSAAGLITGTPAAAGSASFTVQVADFAGNVFLDPLYLYPTPPATAWTTLFAGAPVTGYVVVNVSSGPGTTADPNFTTVINQAKAAGVIPLGYIGSSYGATPLATIQAQAGLWNSLYGVTSILFDEVSAAAAQEPYYTTACEYVTGTKVLNFGAVPDQGYAAIGDLLMVFENTYSAWSAFTPPPWFASYPATKFGVNVYGATQAQMQTVISQASAGGIGVFFVTDENDDNFSALPTYLAAELSYIAGLSAGADATGTLTLTVNAAAGTTNPVGPAGTWTLVFDDEFTGTALDTTKWTALNGDSVNGVTCNPANVSVSGSHLILTLSSGSSGGAVTTNPGLLGSPTSGASGPTLAVGDCCEAKISFPGPSSPAGEFYNFPAWWTSGANWPANGEIDIIECYTGYPVSSYHGNGVNSGIPAPSGTFSNSFHTYTAVRTASTVDIYWDGTLVWAYAPKDNGGPHALILNVGVIAGYPAAYGSASQVLVDYVRMWTPGTTSPALTVTTLTLLAATQNTKYTATLAATGGTGTGYAWAVSAGTLPAGLALSSAGVITGTPTGSGTSSFTVKVTDSGGNTATQALTLAVSAAAGSTAMPIGPSGTWKLVFEDLFPGTSLNTSNWTALQGASINAVTTQASAVSVSGGHLLIGYTGAVNSNPASGYAGPSSGPAVALGNCVEASINFPNGSNWSAWWCDAGNWPSGGEEDIAEILGGSLTAFNYHSPSGANNGPAPSGNWYGGFHTYTLVRGQTTMSVYWDGVLRRTVTRNDSGAAQAMIINQGSGGGGNTIQVAYVRMWTPG